MVRDGGRAKAAGTGEGELRAWDEWVTHITRRKDTKKRLKKHDKAHYLIFVFKCDELASHFYGSKFLSFLLPCLPQNLDKNINSFHIPFSINLADLINVNKEFLPKIPPTKNPPKKIIPKHSS